jgi:cytochrome c oxidase subunit IV
MSNPIVDELAEHPEANAELATEAALDSRHAHPSDAQYILIALGLAFLTAVEVAVYYLHSDSATIGVLLVLMVLKFAVVVGFFMHLRFDSRVLRRLFLGGLTLAVSVYTIVLFAFGIFHV